jgi:hypothetical protein
LFSTKANPGLTSERAYTETERAALAEEGRSFGLGVGAVLGPLGETTLDVYLNESAW